MINFGLGLVADWLAARRRLDDPRLRGGGDRRCDLGGGGRAGGSGGAGGATERSGNPGNSGGTVGGPGTARADHARRARGVSRAYPVPLRTVTWRRGLAIDAAAHG